jgi:hypothetical protein
MDRFYVIRVVNTKNSQRGFVMEVNGEIKIVLDALTPQVSQFSTPRQAMDFIKKHKIEKNGVECLIVNNEELMREMPKGILAAKGEQVFYIESQDGKRRIFFDTQTKEYRFDTKDTGFCCWFDRESAQAFVDDIDPIQQVVMKFSVKQVKNAE